MGNGIDAKIEQLLGDGVEIPDDVVELESLLVDEAAKPTEPDTGTDAEPETKTESEPEAPEKSEPEAAQPAEGEEPKAAEPPQETDDEKGPPRIVLKRTRESLHRAEALLSEREKELQEERERRERAEREASELKSRLEGGQQKLQDKADKLTGGGIPLEGLSDEDIEAMRADLDDNVVDGIKALRNGFLKLSQEVERTREREEAIRKDQEQREAEQVQADIDSVPILAVVAATRGEEADALWQRAIAYEKVIRSDPDFEGKSRREIYTEVGQRLERHLGADAAKWLGEESTSKSPGQVVEDKLARARESALPHSLSDLPAGTPAAQSEQERVDAMSLFDLEEAMEKAFERGGEEAVNELLSRLQTAER